jgi:hypothetical protein
MADGRRSRIAALVPLLATFASGPSSAQPLIIGDDSGSMRGFANRAPQALETVFRVLCWSSNTNRLARMSNLGSSLHISQAKQFGNPQSYASPTTALAESIRYASSGEDWSVIVTDGLESDNLYLHVQGELVRLADEGWGIWLLLLSVPFDGRVDLEQPLLPDRHLTPMRNCALSANPSWTVQQIPNAVRTVRFTGERPLLIFVFDKRPNEVRAWVSRVQAELSRQVARTEAVELSPLYQRHYSVQNADYKSLGVSVTRPSGNSPQRIVADPDDGEKLKKLLFPIAWVNPPSGIAQPFEEQWDLLRESVPSWASLSIIPPKDAAADPGALSLLVDSDPSLKEKFSRLLSRAPVVRTDDPIRFSIVSTLRKPSPGWWKSWHSDTTWECLHKVFKLNDLVETVAMTARARRMKATPPGSLQFQLQIGVD